MRMLVCSVFDSALGSYANPFAVPTAAFAERSFHDEVNNAKSPMYVHPDDFSLYMIGHFDQDTGRLEPMDAMMLCRAVDHKDVSV